MLFKRWKRKKQTGKLVAAIYHLDSDTARRIISKGNVDVNVRDYWGHPLLITAMRRCPEDADKDYWDKQCVEIIKMLLAKGADGNKRCKAAGWTALMWASWIGRADIVKSLLELGVNTEKDREKIARITETTAESYSTSTMKELEKGVFARNIRINAKDRRGRTALMLAANRGRERVEVVKLLLNNGADVDAGDEWGETALMKACAVYQGGEHPEIVKLLLSKGADVNAKNTVNGETALMYAARMGHTKNVEALLSWDADVNMADNNGKTALDHAREWSEKTTIEMLRKVTKLRVEGPKKPDGTPKEKGVASKDTGSTIEGFTIQVSAILEKGLALAQINILKGDGFPAYLEETALIDEGHLFRVFVGSFQTKEEATIILAELLRDARFPNSHIHDQPKGGKGE